MLQIEQKNISIQLKQLLLQKNAINKIIPAVKPLYVTSGALVKTNKGYLFISIPLGKIIVERVNVIALSAQSPLGSKLMGLKLNETITVNNIAYTIEHIE